MPEAGGSGTVRKTLMTEDFGYIEHWYDEVVRRVVEQRRIHPLQFSDIVARAFYQAGLVQFNLSYTSLESPARVILSLRPKMVPGLPPDQRRRAAMISEFTGVPLAKLWNDELDDARSLLVKKNGEFHDIPFEENVTYPM